MKLSDDSRGFEPFRNTAGAYWIDRDSGTVGITPEWATTYEGSGTMQVPDEPARWVD